MSIYVVFHKEHPLLTDDSAYEPIQVGKALSKLDVGFKTDDTGEHISEKNQNYSELTGLYWVWKNTTSEYVGLSHYRRFFMGHKASLLMRLKKIGEYFILQGRKRFGVHYSSTLQAKELILTGVQVDNYLRQYDAIVPIKRKLRYTVLEQYKRKHRIEDLNTTLNIISDLYPDYLDAFNECMQQSEIMHCNMFVLKRSHFNAYMEWLFTILFELERRTDISNYDNYQKRLYGFISERLFDVWLIKNQLKCKVLPILYFKNLKI
jgi:hypothetical protein